MPVEIFLSKANAEPEYETINEEDLLDTDTVIEHIEEAPAADDSSAGSSSSDNSGRNPKG